MVINHPKDIATNEVLNDLAPYLPKGYALTGSGAYKFLISKWADKPAKDLDVVVYPIEGSGILLNEKVVDKFFVVRLFETNRGLQFSLIHKDTGCWVDVFPRDQVPQLIEVDVGGDKKIKAHIIEEVVYGLCLAILERSFHNQYFWLDWIEKLQRLAPYVNAEIFTKVAKQNSNQTSYMLEKFGDSVNSFAMIEYIFKNCRPSSPSHHKFYKNMSYPTDLIVAPNGLSVENETTYNRAMQSHIKYIEKLLGD